MVLKVLVILLTVSVVRAQNMCSPTSTESLKFSISSEYNSTGHQIVTADFMSDHASALNGKTLDVLMETTSCGEVQTARLSAQAAQLPRRDLNKVPPGYKAFPGLGVYRVNTVSKKWLEGHEACLSEGAHLMVVNSKAEADVVGKLCAHFGCSNTPWIGFHTLFKQGHFVTVTGQFLKHSGYMVWHPTYPNGGKESCGCIYNTGLLCDYTCESALPFICEMSSSC